MRRAFFLALSLVVSVTIDPSFAQTPPQPATGENVANLREELSEKLTPLQRIELRFRRQNFRINRGMREGTITEQQGADLKQKLDALHNQFQNDVQAMNGAPNQELLIQTENCLNQTNQTILSLEAAGQSVPQGEKVLGPNWTPGKDGAQKPANLLQQMKQEARRELRQEKQAIEQKVEQQQLDYEKQMIPALGTQKQNIMQQKKDLKQIRQEQGVN